MLTNAQKALLKRAQKECSLSDDEYRDALEMIAGCRSSTSPAMLDRHLDKLLAYFEAIHWRGVDAGTLQRSRSITAVFRQRGYWATKNTSQETSRDRFTGSNLSGQITDLEGQLNTLGFGPGYCSAIRERVIGSRTDDHALRLYLAALNRTVKAKSKRPDPENIPF